MALAFFGGVQGLATQGSCSKEVQPISSTLAPPNSKIMRFYLLSQISPPCKVLVTLTLCALGSFPPKSSVSPFAAGERSSSPRLALNSPIRVSTWQSGDWGPCPCQRVPGSGGSQHQPGLCLVSQPLCSLTAHVLRGMHPAEIPQGFVPPGRKETRPAILACGQGSGKENWWLP